MRQRLNKALVVLVAMASVAIVGALIYADWWSFQQRFPDASFWAWFFSSGR